MMPSKPFSSQLGALFSLQTPRNHVQFSTMNCLKKKNIPSPHRVDPDAMLWGYLGRIPFVSMVLYGVELFVVLNN